MPNELKSIFKDEIYFHLTLRKEELSSKAYRHDKHTLMLFDDYLHSINLAEKSIDESVIEEWIKKISNGISINTACVHMNNIRQLMFFLRNHGYDCFIPKIIAPKDTYVPYLYTDQDLENIFKIADSFTVPHAVKNKYIVYEMPLLLRLLYCCGMRVGEAINMKVGDINFARNLFILRVIKKYKQRLVPFGTKLAEILYLYCIAMGILNNSEAYLFPRDDIFTLISANSVGNYYRIIRKKADTLHRYIVHRHIKKYPENHIFSSQTHEQMTISCVEDIYKKYTIIAKNQNPSLFPADTYPSHSMRHSTACHLPEADIDIVTIKNILGHVSVQITQIYSEMSQDTVDRKLKEWNETWFGDNHKVNIKKATDNIPEFLKRR